ncbi:MAG: hypothetical protein ACRD3V_10510 [Vicinamibacteria bacterium]
MDREQFIRVLRTCIESATGRVYPDIEWERLSDRALIECAELVRVCWKGGRGSRIRPSRFPAS